MLYDLVAFKTRLLVEPELAIGTALIELTHNLPDDMSGFRLTDKDIHAIGYLSRYVLKTDLNGAALVKRILAVAEAVLATPEDEIKQRHKAEFEPKIKAIMAEANDLYEANSGPFTDALNKAECGAALLVALTIRFMFQEA